jgi:hypothetical protein
MQNLDYSQVHISHSRSPATMQLLGKACVYPLGGPPRGETPANELEPLRNILMVLIKNSR